MKVNGFIIALILAVATAYFFPEGAVLFSLSTVTTIGIGFIFFIYGLKLSPSEFRKGMGNYKLPLLVQLTTFLFFPLLVLLFFPLAKETVFSNYWHAFFFMAVVPSTVSSSVILVSLAKGNIPAAIFNASISGIIGIAVTPFWLGLFLEMEQSPSFWEILLKLVLQIILPLFLGLLLQRFFEKIINAHEERLKIFDKTIIALIVYSSFSASFSAGVFSGFGFWHLFFLIGIVVALFFMVYFGLGLISKKLGFTRDDRITAQYCGSQKSLVHGSVMAKIIFGNSPTIGLILLPLMLYHFTQILLISWFAESEKAKTQ